MLFICPTADYEIYLGKNLLSPEQVLFEPTRKLVQVWDEFALHATLFPDICSVWRHRELGLDAYADRFEEQVRDIGRSGHDVQLHLHPEWLMATYDGSTWTFAPGTSALHDRGFEHDDPEGAPALIHKGRDFLQGLLQAEIPGYRCIAFRAGGWLLQPEQALVAALRDAGIRVDATVIPGVRLLRTDYPIDFRRAPGDSNWHIGARLGLAVDSEDPDDVLEIPIAAFRGHLAILQHVINELRLRRRARRRPEPRRGYPVGKLGEKHGPLDRIRRKWRKLSTPRVLDAADTCESMLTTVRSYLRTTDCTSRDVAICMNGHPKDTYDYHLDELRRFFDHVLSRYANTIRFSSIAAYHARLAGSNATSQHASS